MTIEERELGRLLKETVGLSDPPRFTAGELTRRAGRRRARLIAGVLGAAAAVAAAAVIVPGALSGHRQHAPAAGPAAAPSSSPVEATYTVTVNGRTRDVPFGHPADYAVTPGERLSIAVELHLPARTSVTTTGLWLGITNGVLSGDRNGPADMAPILVADPRAALGPGTHTFTLHWTVPAGLQAGASRQLSTELAWGDGDTMERFVAVFTASAAADGEG